MSSWQRLAHKVRGCANDRDQDDTEDVEPFPLKLNNIREVIKIFITVTQPKQPKRLQSLLLIQHKKVIIMLPPQRNV